MEEQLKMAIMQAVGLAQELINLSSAILVLSIAFVNNILKESKLCDRSLLSVSWIFYLLTIIAGIWTRMAITGSLADGPKPMGTMESNIRLPAAIQIILFVMATLFFLVFAIKGIYSERKAKSSRSKTYYKRYILPRNLQRKIRRRI
ncbi:MAG: hypothetical protein AB4372_21890 [Xenococcus sp. (in: cyanobacteria)]